MELVILILCIYLIIRFRRVLISFIFGYVLFVLLLFVIALLCIIFHL